MMDQAIREELAAIRKRKSSNSAAVIRATSKKIIDRSQADNVRHYRMLIREHLMGRTGS